MNEDEFEDPTMLDRQLSDNVGGPELRVALDVSGDALTLRYEVENPTGAPILLQTVFGNPKTPGRFDPNRAFHEIEDGVLVFVKAAISPYLPIAVPQWPSSVRLPPSDTFADSMTLPLPVAFDNPLLPVDPSRPHEPIECSAVRLRVGWIFQSDLPEPVEPVTVGEQVVYPVGLGPSTKLQRILESQLIPARVVVNDPIPMPPRGR